jgi:Mg/Co/Ni transporter MgtE
METQDVELFVASVAEAGAVADSTQSWGGETVGSLVSGNFVSLPAWFPADKAVAVLRNKGKRFALIRDRDGRLRVADLRQLVSASSTKSVSWCALPLGPTVAPVASLNEVMRLMDAHQSAYLPVVTCRVLVGIFARDVATGYATPPVAERSAA